MAQVVIMMGSKSDEEKVSPCVDVLRSLGISYLFTVSSAHRTPERTEKILREQEAAGAKVFICAAGMAAHLAGAVAARTTRPVIGIPVSGGLMGGMDAMLATVQMPPGFPVATVAMDKAGARNAAWLAAQILAVADPALDEKIRAARAKMQAGVEEAAAEEASRKASISRKQARAARIAADQAEEEEDIKLVDPEAAMHAARRRSGILSFRSLLVLLLAAAAAYLSFAPSFEALPLPVVLDILQNPTIGIGALAALQILALLIGIDVFGNGFSSLLHGRPARGTLVSFAALASLLHCASLLVFPDQGGVAVPYTAVSILLLYAEMREARGRSLAQARSYRAVCEAEQPLAVYSHYDSEIDACNAVKCPLYDASSFLTEIERPDTVDRFSLIYTPIALALAIILSLVASFNCGEPVRFFWAFSAILSVSAPIGLLCAFGASYKNTASRLLRSGAAIAGARHVDTQKAVFDHAA